MKTYKEVIRTLQAVDKYLCDWCGEEIVDDDDWYTNNITVEYTRNYGAYGDAWTELDSWKVDLCVNCMKKVRKFLEDNKVKIQELG